MNIGVDKNDYNLSLFSSDISWAEWWILCSSRWSAIGLKGCKMISLAQIVILGSTSSKDYFY